jgi:hypothetical protein
MLHPAQVIYHLHLPFPIPIRLLVMDRCTWPAEGTNFAQIRTERTSNEEKGGLMLLAPADKDNR